MCRCTLCMYNGVSSDRITWGYGSDGDKDEDEGIKDEEQKAPMPYVR